MGQTSLLKLHCCSVCQNSAEDFFLDQVIHESIVLLLEDPTCNVRAIMWLLTRVECFLDLFPSGITCECDENVRLPKGSHNGHGILKCFTVKARGSIHSKGQDDFPTSIDQISLFLGIN